MTLNDFVCKIYCINLDRRTDRWARCEEIFKKHKLIVERISAIDGNDIEQNWYGLPPAVVALSRTSLNIFKEARRNNYSNFALFEDDVELDDDFNRLFNLYIKQVPDDWELIYMGGNIKRAPVHVSKSIDRVVLMYSAYAIIFRDTVYDKIIRMLTNERRQNDLSYALLQKNHPSYAFTPCLAWVRNDFSDLNGRFIDVSFLRTQHEKQN